MITPNCSIAEMFNDLKFNELVIKEMDGIRKHIGRNKSIKSGVILFMKEFSIEEIKFQFIRLIEKKAYLTSIQKRLINSIIRNSIVNTYTWYSSEEYRKSLIMKETTNA